MSDSLSEKVVLAMVGPLTAAIVGTLIIGLLVGWITRRTQERRAWYDLRRELITQMTEAASALVYTITHYRRIKQGMLGHELQLADIAPILHEQYRKTRTAGTVLENRLETYFRSDRPRRCWHAAMDLLSVRYYEVLGQATEELREANAGDSHTGLTAHELEDTDLVWKRYREAMRRATDAALNEPLSRVRSTG